MGMTSGLRVVNHAANNGGPGPDLRRAELARLKRAARLEKDIVKAARQVRQLMQKADEAIAELRGPAAAPAADEDS